MQNIIAPDEAQYTRDYHDMMRPLVRALKDIYGYEPRFDDDALRRAFREWLPSGDLKPQSKWEASAHECGHVAAYAAAGASLVHVEIYASVPGCWRGITIHAPFHLPLVGVTDPGLFCCLARFTLAGPVAEQIVGGGNALGNFTELLRARTFSDRAAELLGAPSSITWTGNVFAAVTMFEHHARDIEALAKILERVRVFAPDNSKVRRVLNRIVARGPITGTLSPKGAALAERIASEIPCMATLLKSECE